MGYQTNMMLFQARSKSSHIIERHTPLPEQINHAHNNIIDPYIGSSNPRRRSAHGPLAPDADGSHLPLQYILSHLDGTFGQLGETGHFQRVALPVDALS